MGTRLRNLKKSYKEPRRKRKINRKINRRIIDLLRSGDTSKSQFSRKNVERHMGNAVSQNVYGRRTSTKDVRPVKIRGARGSE